MSTFSPLSSDDFSTRLMTFVRTLLYRSNVHSGMLDTLLSHPDIVQQYTSAFTHPEIDSIHNYELYEFIGDSVMNHSIVEYIYSRYPNASPIHVPVFARLKIYMANKTFLANVAHKHGFREFIRAPVEQTEFNMRVLLEDTFEAFMGCTYSIFNTQMAPYSGNVVVLKIMEYVLDTMVLPTTYEELVDAVSRLKEVRDVYPDLHVRIEWMDRGTSNGSSQYVPHTAKVVYKTHPPKYFSSNKKTDAHQQACAYVLECLQRDRIPCRPKLDRNRVADTQSQIVHTKPAQSQIVHAKPAQSQIVDPYAILSTRRQPTCTK
jgi:dsRNA-specific ribonuclease